jgi:hypothetical protein
LPNKMPPELGQSKRRMRFPRQTERQLRQRAPKRKDGRRTESLRHGGRRFKLRKSPPAYGHSAGAQMRFDSAPPSAR